MKNKDTAFLNSLYMDFTTENCPTLAKFVFKIFNNRGIVVSEFKSD